MSGCWWQCMELTPRVEKTFLSRERATFLTSSNKVHTLEKSWWWNKITPYLDNEELLEQFINNEEPKYFNKEKRSKRKRAEVENEEFEPEEAFLKIGSNLRQVLLLSFTVSPSFSHHRQGRIDFTTVNPSLPTGMDFVIHPCRWIDDYENVRTPPKLGRYWEIHPLRPRDFPIPPSFWWSTDTIRCSSLPNLYKS